VETFNDKLRAWALATAIHLIFAVLLFAGLFWTASGQTDDRRPGD